MFIQNKYIWIYLIMFLAFADRSLADSARSKWREAPQKKRGGEETCAVLTRDDKFVFSGYFNGLFEKHELNSNKFHYLKEPAGIFSVALSHDGKLLASGSWEDSVGTVTIRESSSGNVLWSQKAHKSFVRAVAFSPDKSILASASSDNSILIWDSQTGRLKRTLKHDRIFCDIAFSHDGNTLISVGSKGFIRLWDMSSDKAIDLNIGHKKNVLAVELRQTE